MNLYNLNKFKATELVFSYLEDASALIQKASVRN